MRSNRAASGERCVWIARVSHLYDWAAHFIACWLSLALASVWRPGFLMVTGEQRIVSLAQKINRSYRISSGGWFSHQPADNCYEHSNDWPLVSVLFITTLARLPRYGLLGL
jgi:hypothetical protein